MLSRSYQQYAIVAADSAQTLTELLNAKLLELKDKNPTVTFEGMIARIQYTESEQIPESISEEYEAQGVRLTCQDCPYFCPTIKADGTIDQRSKWGSCPLSEYGRTRKGSSVCDTLFQKLNNGEVRLCVNGIE